ncbi:cell wall protein RBR3-like [Diaphorina citri]|uniref:Cell wall protein RBR3-like n=1 Tax=Diaphorina citri TaxID=121845 RepID=A0A3Q0IWS4_DIACI|nr:cell wall protein RBR3-like [Diaphorina citri]
MRAQHCQCEGRTELGMWKVETHKPATTNSRQVYTTRNTPTPSSIPPSREQNTSRFHTELNSKLSSYFEEYTVQPQHLSLPTTPCYEVYRSTTKPTESFPPTPNSQSDDQLCREPWEQNKSDRQSSRRRSPDKSDRQSSRRQSTEKSDRQSTRRWSSEKSDRQSSRRQSTEKSDRQSTQRWSPEKQSEFGCSRTPTRYARESSEHIGEPRTWPSDSEESESSTIVIAHRGTADMAVRFRGERFEYDRYRLTFVNHLFLV